MRTGRFILVVLALLCIASADAYPAEKKRVLDLENFDQLNWKMTDSGSVWYGSGHIQMRVDSTRIRSDSMVWLREQNIIHFYRNVEAYDTVQHIRADQISYYHRDSVMLAFGDVTMIHRTDSVKTESQTAEYDRAEAAVYLEGDPRLFLNYPDSAELVEITATYLTFYTETRQAEAQENVVITYRNTRATAGCGEFYRNDNVLTLMDDPYATRDSSDISGKLMHIWFAGGGVRQIDVLDEATANFVEESDSATGEFSGESMLSGNNITFYFKGDEIRKIAAAGAARSEYFPSPEDTTGAGKNFVSGDSISIYVGDQRIRKVEIAGGAEGVYITEKDSAEVAWEDSARQATLPGSGARAADSVKADTAGAAAVAVADSTAGDSALIPDTLISSASPEDSIHYRGRYLEYFAPNRIIRITGGAKVRQGQMTLDAEEVEYDVPGRVVLARARVDTVDTNEKITPLALQDGSEKIFGSRLVFNVDTKRGLIEDATTQYENAYYRGQDLFKEEEKVFYVEHGRLTSCDLEEPHFHFRSSRMKLIHNDRVIARPVTLYIETLPIVTIPYYIFPLKRGRHSGILPIRLGNFEQGNRFIGNLGYYWAASEYWDVQTSLDFHENIGINITGNFRYTKRYAYSGAVTGSYARDRRESAGGEFKANRWQVRGDHAQTLPYDIDFRASGQFVSDKNYSTDFSTDPNERRNRNIISKANFNKRFGKASLTFSFSHTDNLDAESRQSSLPTGGLTMPSFHPFGSGREVDGKTVKKWYNHLYAGYRNNFSVYTDRRKATGIIQLGDGTFQTYSYKTRKEYAYLDHSMSLSAPQKLFSYITLNPSASLRETWYYIMETDQAEAAGIPARRPYRRGAVSAGINSNTNLYGTFPVNVFGLMALRHVLTPSVGFSWSPAITKNEPVRRYTGKGGGSPGQQKALSFSLQHLFQAKIETEESEKKLDLIRISSDLSYNFEATDRKFSNLSTSLSSTLINNVNLHGSLTHDLYDQNNELNWRSPSLRTFSISASFQARGSVADDYVRQGLEAEPTPDTLGLFPSPGVGAAAAADKTGPAGGAGWNLNVSYSYSESRSFGKTTSRTHWLQFTFNLDITANWKLKYSQKYDFIRHESIDKIVDLFRRIHCWEGHFYWIPTGSRQGYYFKINVIAIPDIKVEKSESGLRGALFNR